MMSPLNGTPGPLRALLPAQLPDLSVPPLAKPPFLQSILFESPLVGVALLVGLAVVAVAVGNQRAQLRTGLAVAVAGLLAAGGLFLSATLVQTERERLFNASVALAEAVGRGDADAAAPMIAERFRYTGYPAGADWDRARLLEAIPRRVPGAGVSDVVVLEVQVELDSELVARSQLRVRPESDGRPLDMPSWWLLDWQKDRDTGDWRCVGVEPIAATWLR